MILRYLKKLIQPIQPIQMGVFPMALAAAVPGVIKGVTGLIQQGKAKKITADPVSAATKEATSLAQQRALATQMPGEEQIQENIQQSTQQGVANIQKGATSSADVLGGVSALTAGEQGQMRQLGIQSAQYKDQAGQQYQQQLARKGAEEERNRREAQATAEQYRSAGMQNIFSGLSDLGNVGMAAAMGMFDEDGGGGATDMVGGVTAAAKQAGAQNRMQMNMAQDFQSGFGQTINPLANKGPQLAGVTPQKGQISYDMSNNLGNPLLGLQGNQLQGIAGNIPQQRQPNMANFGQIQDPLSGLLQRKKITI